MNALVTGGAGFIGIYLVDRLLHEGHTVRVLDRFSGNKKIECRKRWKGKKIRLVECDISLGVQSQKLKVKSNNLKLESERNIDRLFTDTLDFRLLTLNFRGIDWLFHLAANSQKGVSIKQPLEFHRVNVDGTVIVLEAARQAGVQKFIYTGTASCYGIPDTNPIPETAAMKLSDPYALTKYLGEQYTLHWGNVYKLPVLILRLFNVYGPQTIQSSSYGSTLSIFMSQKLRGKLYTIAGDGTQKRDFTYVSDVVDAYMKAAQSTVKNEVFNIATGKGRSINELLNFLGGGKRYLPKSKTEPDVLYADIRKAKKLLGWEPKVSLEEGIERVLQNS